MSDHWKNQPRVPAGDEHGGQWTDSMHVMAMPPAEAKALAERNAKGKVTVDGIAQIFDDLAIAKYGRQLDINDPADYKLMLEGMVTELGWQLKQPYSGIDWYDKDVSEAMRISMKEFPSLENDNRRMLFLVASGIQSQNTAPADQLYLALQSWEGFEAEGRFAMVKPNGKNWGLAAKTSSLDSMNKLIDARGVNGAVEFMYSEHTISELRDLKAAHGMSRGAIKGREETVVPGLRFFGPKIGAFVRNMNGIHDTTVDLWAVRTVNRQAGRMLGSDGTVQGAPRSESERASMKRLFKQAGEAYGLSAQEAQAGLWFYEQNLFKRMGTTQRNPSLSAGAARFASERAGRGRGVPRVRAAGRSPGVSLAPRIARKG